MRALALISSAITGTTAGTALACSPVPVPEGWTPPPVVTGEMCSFRANPNFYYDIIGGKVFELAPGTVAQRLDYVGFGDPLETMVVADCASGDAIELIGEVVPGTLINSCGEGGHIDQILVPNGRIRLTKASTVQDLKRVAQNHSYEFRDGAEEITERKPEFDLFCGCRLLQPDSAGAALSVPEEQG